MNLNKKYSFFSLLGTKIAAITPKEVVNFIEKTIRTKRQRLIFTINLDHLQKMSKDKAFKKIYCQVDLVVADGMPIVWLSRIFSPIPLPARINGTNLVEKILMKSKASNFRIFLFGAKKQILEKLRQKYTQAKIVGTISPPSNTPPNRWPNGQFCQQIRKSKTNILLVALGPPKQEKWLVNNFDKTGANIGIGVGSAFDLLAGIKKRAPKWMQNTGLEWLFRLIQEPRRLGPRYSRQILFIPALLVKLFHEGCSDS